ncbi:hypothetical protein COBT_002164 [Conglomerata obtusa]
MLYPEKINTRFRACARLVFSKFLPSYLSLFLTPSIDDWTKLNVDLVRIINIYMIKCVIKYDVFATINYNVYNKNDLYEWADALDCTSSSIINDIYLTLLMKLERVPLFKVARDLILQNLTDIFYKYIDTQNEFLKDSNEDVIILQRREYYFENDQTKHIQEIIEKSYK